MSEEEIDDDVDDVDNADSEEVEEEEEEEEEEGAEEAISLTAACSGFLTLSLSALMQQCQ